MKCPVCSSNGLYDPEYEDFYCFNHPGGIFFRDLYLIIEQPPHIFIYGDVNLEDIGMQTGSTKIYLKGNNFKEALEQYLKYQALL